MKRIVVVGTSGAGKSTFAARLAKALQISHVELDSLYWEPGWKAVSREVFRERAIEALNGHSWIIDGNYSAVREMIWEQADTIVWLNYSFSTVLGRILYRTWRRLFRGELCCNGNRETWALAISRDSVIWWVITTYHRRRREYSELLPRLANTQRTIMTFRQPVEANQWLRDIERLSTSESSQQVSTT